MSFYSAGSTPTGFHWERTRPSGVNAQSAALCGWITVAADGTYRRYLHHKSFNPSSNISFSLQITQDPNGYLYAAEDNAGSTNERLRYNASTDELVHVFAWATSSGSDLKFWVNGVQQTDTSAPPLNFGTGGVENRFCVGYRSDISSAAKGDFSEVAHWTRDELETLPAPTDDQVRAIMAGAWPGIYAPDDLMVVAPFQDALQPAIYEDSSITGRTQTGTPVQGTEHGLISGPAAIFVPSAAGGGPTYTLTAAKGSYTLTGQAAALTASRKLTADKGSYAYTGYDAGLRSGRKLLAAKGSYAITGYGANLKAARVLTASKGAYALTGYAATLTYTPISGPTYTLTANAGSYAYTGYDAILRASRVLAAGNGSYTLTGYNAALNYSGNVAVEAYTFAGGPFAGSAFSGSQVEGVPATADTVTLTFVADVGSLVSLTTVEIETLSAISESTDIQALVTTGFSDPRAFFWPSVNGYQVKPLVDPLDQMHFLTVGTDTAKQVAADAGFTQIHTNPVKVDRFGNIPSVFVDSASAYRFILKNQFGVTKWEAGSYTWPNTVEDHLSLPPISETNTLVALTTSEP